MAFSGQIHVVKFLDAQGFPDSGVVGDSAGIWYTINGGTTWTASTVTSPIGLQPFITGWVNDFTFEADGQHGYAVITNDFTLPPESGILLTSDAGHTWVFDTAAGTPDSGRGIYFNPANGRLFVASCDSARGLVYSTNRGLSWTVIDTNNYYTGFAFNGGGFGVLATEGTICNTRTQNFWLITTNGGLSWQPSRNYTQSWQPLSIPTTELFFASTTHDCAGITNAILSSGDAGYGFAPITGYNSATPDTLAEDMAGDGCEQFASSSHTNVGMWVSTNDGANWTTIAQAPIPALDTRFYVSPDTVWSFTYDSLKSIPRPKTGDIHIWPDTFAFKSAACMKTSDTAIHIFGCNCANTLMLVGDSIHHFNSADNAPISVVPAIPPSQSLCLNGLGVADSVHLHFQPVADNPDTADIHLLFTDNGVPVDTIVHMTANGISPQLELRDANGDSITHNIDLSGPACSGTIDTFIYAINTSCDPITLQASTVNENPQDQCQLQLTGICTFDNDASSGSPVTILPGGAPQRIDIEYQPGLKIGCNGASFALNWTSSGGTQGTTQLVVVNGCTSTTEKPTFRGFNTTKQNCCDVNDTLIYFINSTCDTILLQEPVISGHTSCAKNFTLDPKAGGITIQWPVKLPPAAFIPLTIDINCEGAGTCQAYITFNYTIAAYFSQTSSCSSSLDCSAFASDQLIDTISLTSKGGFTPPTMTPNQVNFGDVNCCDSTELKTVTITAGCKPDTLTSLRLFNSAAQNFYIAPPGLSFPVILNSNQPSVTFQVGFLPHCDGGSGGTDKGSVSLYYGTGSGNDSLNTQITATSTNLATASVNPTDDSLLFGTVLSCAPQTCQTVTLTNASCGPVVMNISQRPTHACFTVSNLSSGSVGVTDTLQSTVCFNPATGNDTGAIEDFVVYQICDPGGSSCTTDTVWLAAYITPPLAIDSITPIASATICDSQMVGETFTFTNKGTCYTYTITGASTGNPQVTVQPSSSGQFPVTVDTGASQTFNVTFMPTSVGTFSGVVTLTNSDGTSETVPYSFTDTSCSVNTGIFTLGLKPGNTITTPQCNIGKLIYTVSAGGGSGTFTGISVTGSNRFVPVGPNGPETLPYTDTITFDPNQIGGNSALVTLNYTIDGTPGTDTFTIYGVVTGVKDSTRIGVLGLTQGCIIPNDTMLDTFAIVLRDTIQDALNVDSVSFIINYDGNLLFNPSAFDLANGWTVKSISDQKDGIHLTLTYSGNPPTNNTPAGDTLLKITQLGAISDSVISVAVVTNTHFNDSTFEACVMKALGSSGDFASICIDTTTCGGRPIYDVINKTIPPFSGIQVVPNPAHKGSSAATLHFTTNMAANVTADVLDVLGNTVLSLPAGAMEAGDHAIAIPTTAIPEGAYFTRITAGGFTVIRQFVLVKE